MRVTWPQALGWRMQRQLLDQIGSVSAVEVVRRLGGVPAQVASSAELKVRVRRTQSRAGDVIRRASRPTLAFLSRSPRLSGSAARLADPARVSCRRR